MDWSITYIVSQIFTILTYLFLALTYYAKNRILTDDKKQTQENILVIKCIRYTIYNALNLIGVIPPEKM